jgi:calcium/calmodulin-dependent protein kinase I
VRLNLILEFTQDSFETTHKLFIVMELIKGGDLFDRIIDKGKYSEFEAREVMRMLLEAVKYLHSKGIVHRDLKPENILLVDNSPTSQVDFPSALSLPLIGVLTFSPHLTPALDQNL